MNPAELRVAGCHFFKKARSVPSKENGKFWVLGKTQLLYGATISMSRTTAGDRPRKLPTRRTRQTRVLPRTSGRSSLLNAARHAPMGILKEKVHIWRLLGDHSLPGPTPKAVLRHGLKSYQRFLFRFLPRLWHDYLRVARAHLDISQI